MKNLTLSEKYTVLVLNDKGDVGSLFGMEKQGLCISALLELFSEKLIEGSKKVEIKAQLPEQNNEVKVMYDFVSEKEHKSIKSIMGSFTSPLHIKERKELKENMLDSVKNKISEGDFKTVLEGIVDGIRNIKGDDLDSIILAKIIVELKVAKYHVDKAKRKELKEYLKNNDNFNEEMKEIMKIINGMAAAGAMAGAGVV